MDIVEKRRESSLSPRYLLRGAVVSKRYHGKSLTFAVIGSREGLQRNLPSSLSSSESERERQEVSEKEERREEKETTLGEEKEGAKGGEADQMLRENKQLNFAEDDLELITVCFDKNYYVKQREEREREQLERGLEEKERTWVDEREEGEVMAFPEQKADLRHADRVMLRLCEAREKNRDGSVRLVVLEWRLITRLNAGERDNRTTQVDESAKTEEEEREREEKDVSPMRRNVSSSKRQADQKEDLSLSSVTPEKLNRLLLRSSVYSAATIACPLLSSPPLPSISFPSRISLLSSVAMASLLAFSVLRLWSRRRYSRLSLDLQALRQDVHGDALGKKETKETEEVCHRLFITLPSGFEDIAAEELREKIGATDIVFLEGKLLFSLPTSSLSRLSSLRCAEKFFAFVADVREVPSGRDVLEALRLPLWEAVGEKRLTAALRTWLTYERERMRVKRVDMTTSPSSSSEEMHAATETTRSSTLIESNSSSSRLSSSVPAAASLPSPSSTSVLSFRVKAKLGGRPPVGKDGVARAIAEGLASTFGLTPAMKGFSIEVFAHLHYNPPYTSGSLLLGLSLPEAKEAAYTETGRAVGEGMSSSGRELSATSLRPTLAYSLLRVAQVHPGDIVMDPMCGCGTIPELGGLHFPEVFFLAGDKYDVAISKTKKNLSRHKGIKCDVVQWDIERLPLRRGCIDAIVTDMPFGKRMGSHHKNNRLYPLALGEICRVAAKPSGRSVLLTTEKKVVYRQIHRNRTWRTHRQTTVTVGGLNAKCFHLSYI